MHKKSSTTDEQRAINKINGIAKQRKTMLERTGYENSFSNPAVIAETQRKNALNKAAIIEKIKTTTQKNHGVDFYVLHPSVPKVKNRKHYSKETLEIIEDDEKFREFMKTRSVSQAAAELKIWPSTICTYCRNIGIEFNRNRSTYEVEIETFLTDHNIKYIKNSRYIIPPQELDFYLPDFKLALEFNGLYYHSDSERGKLDKFYHFNKLQECENNCVRLLSINEDEWLEHPDAIKSRILNICGKTERSVGARKLSIKSISIADAQNFTETYHIQGKVHSAFYAAGAFLGEDLVGIMTFSHQRGTDIVELNRFCSDGKSYPGLFSRLFKFSVKENSFTAIVSFADRRYSQGDVYEKNGFVYTGNTPVDYRYVRGSKTFHKQYLSKNNIAKKFKIDIEGKTETELSNELGFHRIYDCGKMRFVWPSVDAITEFKDSDEIDDSIDRIVSIKGKKPASEFSDLAAITLASKEKLNEFISEKSIPVIAKELGISKKTVYEYIKKYDLNLNGRKYTYYNKKVRSILDDKETLENFISDKSIEIAAKELGMAMSTLYEKIKKAGIVGYDYKNLYSPATTKIISDKTLLEEFISTRKMKDVIDELGINKSSLYKIIHKHNIELRRK